jgi:transposase
MTTRRYALRDDQCRWSKTGVWNRVFQHLADDADNEYAMIDATIVRAHQHSAGAKGGSQLLKRSVAAKAD